MIAVNHANRELTVVVLTIIRIRVLIRAMYICNCNAVTDHDIHREVADGVQSFAQLQERTGCSDCCGCCESEARATFAKAVDQVRCPLTVVSATA